MKTKKKFQRRILPLLCLLLIPVLLLSCSDKGDEGSTVEDPSPQAKSYYEFFDTVSVVISYRGDEAGVFEENCREVAELLREYHRLFDIYYEYAGVNNLKTVNKNAGKAPVKVDQRLIDFLLYCKEIHTLTGGATNVAMGSVLSLWHDAREDGINDPEDAALPSMDALTEAAGHTDINKLIIDEAASTVYLEDPAMRLDVGAIGKGYAAERAAELLIERGVTSYVLNIGGNLRAIGTKPSGSGWLTGITDPDKSDAESFIGKVVIQDVSLVTSGDYERYYEVDGKPYHHIIDPQTNMPAAYFSSVSVLAKDSGLADALSTALFCMSHEQGLQLIKGIDGVEVIWVDPDGTVLKTDGVTFRDEEQ